MRVPLFNFLCFDYLSDSIDLLDNFLFRFFIDSVWCEERNTCAQPIIASAVFNCDDIGITIVQYFRQFPANFSFIFCGNVYIYCG